VALVQGGKDGALIRKVLVNGADAHPRNLGDAVGGDRLHAIALQDPGHRIKYRFHRLPRAKLSRPPPDLHYPPV
jgi:hypothetical protein